MNHTNALSVDTFDLELDVYQGPFDLLFTLILREEVDIFEVPVLDIILAWMEERTAAGETNWESLTEFLVLVSSLLEWKSRILLPGWEPSDDELGPEEAREALLARLVRYHSFKSAAESLAARLDGQRGRMLRPAERAPRHRLKTEEQIRSSADPKDLSAALERMLAATRPPDTAHLPPAHVPMAERLATIRHMLSRHGGFSFEAAFGAEEPMVQAVTLFALLELLSRSRIEVRQESVFADIHVRAAEARNIA